jgi:hypothetical protein
MGTTLLTRDQLLAAAKDAEAAAPREPLEIAELGGTVYIRGMSGRERDAFEESLRIKKGKRAGETDLRNFRGKIATRCLVDADGKRLLTDSDADLIGHLSAGILDRILAVINRLSGRTEEEAEELGNDSASPAASAASASSSPSSSI